MVRAAPAQAPTASDRRRVADSNGRAAARRDNPSRSNAAITPMEFDLLRTFADHPGRVLSRDQLLDLAHNAEMTPFDRSIDMRIGRLRRKIEPDPQVPQTLKTIRGAGYIFLPAGSRG